MSSSWDEPFDITGVTSDGAAWPDAPVILPCGSVFDVVNAPAIFGRRMLDRLWDEGAGSGPVAVFRGRMLLFTAPGTAQRLPALLEWEEWGAQGGQDSQDSHNRRTASIPPLLCHGTGDTVTVPPLTGPALTGPALAGSRWLVAPDPRHPWLPGPEVLLRAAVRAARSALRISISRAEDQGARVYDVSRRR